MQVLLLILELIDVTISILKNVSDESTLQFIMTMFYKLKSCTL